jgi:hypothetical protein
MIHYSMRIDGADWLASSSAIPYRFPETRVNCVLHQLIGRRFSTFHDHHDPSCGIPPYLVLVYAVSTTSCIYLYRRTANFSRNDTGQSTHWSIFALYFFQTTIFAFKINLLNQLHADYMMSQFIFLAYRECINIL